MLLAFGVIFQMPTIVFFLARMGMVTAGFLIKHTKYAVLIIFILGAVLSPGTDVVSQALMAGPMLVLYVLSIGIAWLFAKKKAGRRLVQGSEFKVQQSSVEYQLSRTCLNSEPLNPEPTVKWS